MPTSTINWGNHTNDFDAASGILGEHEMIHSVKTAIIFCVPSATETIPAGYIFVNTVKLSIDNGCESQ